tara:strand:- start:1775 stop:2014 length:240 start_codon:yes stop_codon:yes gene_type:complete
MTAVFEQHSNGIWIYKNLTLMLNGAYAYTLCITNSCISDDEPDTICEVPSLRALYALLETLCNGAVPVFTTDADQQHKV